MARKKSLFEMLCTMDDDSVDLYGAPNKTKQKGTANGRDVQASDKSRRTVSSHSVDPYGPDDDFPALSEEKADSAGERAYEDFPGKAEREPIEVYPGSGGSFTYDDTATQPKPKRTSSTRTSSASGKKAGGSKAKSKTRSAPRKVRSPAGEFFWRAEPFFALGFGLLLLAVLILSGVRSAGRFDLTVETHPFRWFGFWTERILFGLVGYGTFLLPLGMIYLAILQFRSKRTCPMGLRIFCFILILLLAPAMIHTGMIGANAAGGATYTRDVAKLFNLGADKCGGGVLAGLLGWLLFRGLGVVGTMLLGALVLAIALMLFFGTTPAALWRRLREWYDDRSERRAEEARTRAEEDARDPFALPEERGKENSRSSVKASGRNEKKQRKDALREAESSDRRERRREENRTGANESGFVNPTQALLNQYKRPGSVGMRATAETKAPAPSIGSKKRNAPVPLETVVELSPEEVASREKEYSGRRPPSAVTIPVFDEPDDPLEAEPIVEYPARAEITLDSRPEDEPNIFDTAVTEENADAGKSEALPKAEEEEPEVTLFDLNEEPDEDTIPGKPEEEKTQSANLHGVEVRVEKLSKAERERGEKIVPDDDLFRSDEEKEREYVFPKIEFLNEAPPRTAAVEEDLMAKAGLLEKTLSDFHVKVESIDYVCGPTVTRFEIKPAPGVRVRAISNLIDDIALSLAASGIRMEAPIPGKTAIGIEIANEHPETVSLRGLIDSDEFRGRKSKLTACLGEDVGGNSIMFDIVKMPHLLIAGTTGSGKSVCINSVILSLLYKARPDEVKLILIDPKTVEFSVYHDIPHLMAPIVCEAKRAAAALNLAVVEMERRFEQIRQVGARDIAGYNAATVNDRYEHPFMPQIVIIIDELADLMMQARDEVENSICRLAQKARAAGMHLIVGTQRPSVDVVTGLIKANVPSRIAFAVKQQVDSRVMLDTVGAEKLIGHGDMLYAPIGCQKPLRVQGAFVSDGEVERIVEFIRRNNAPVRYDEDFLNNLDREAELIGKQRPSGDSDEGESEDPDGLDSKFYEAIRIALDNNRISTSLLQRTLSVGYSRAAKIVDQMEARGFVSHAVGNKPREIRITRADYEELMANRNN